jgi:hypothetical protein
MKPHLTLAEALRSGRLGDFVTQAEALSVGPAEEADFDEAVRRLATEPRSADRTSRSPFRGGSTGK